MAVHHHHIIMMIARPQHFHFSHLTTIYHSKMPTTNVPTLPVMVGVLALTMLLVAGLMKPKLISAHNPSMEQKTKVPTGHLMMIAVYSFLLILPRQPLTSK